ncbi:atherin-like [Chiroxiphia lanceolata]|uniref:atherin-like n=1 Tax=Chiroxiphia lanceolata TaxID=296741 RepID=UPI0013CF01AF|nr:atherin-like [Chiroxiphia lanceolata]
MRGAAAAHAPRPRPCPARAPARPPSRGSAAPSAAPSGAEGPLTNPSQTPHQPSSRCPPRSGPGLGDKGLSAHRLDGLEEFTALGSRTAKPASSASRPRPKLGCLWKRMEKASV